MQNEQKRHRQLRNGKHAAAAACGAGAIVSLIATLGAPAAATSCATVAACIFGENTRGTSGSGSGADAGIFGISLKGDGVDGETTQISTAAHASSGVAGYDESKSGTYNNGVFGYSALGTGVHGTTGTGTAVYGNAVTTGIGVDGKSATGTGVYGSSRSGAGAQFFTNSGYGIYTSAATGLGIYVVSRGLFGLVTSDAATDGTALLASINSSGTIFEGFNASQDQDEVTIDYAGNEILAGTLTQSGTSLVRTATAAGSTVVAYTPRTSSPTLEDFGEAQLSNGAAYVPLDQTYASTIDQHAKYMVFLTPQGDNSGLYVTALSPRGFAVRESRGGHSTLAFDYRIVAKPYDTNAARLASTTRFSGLAGHRALPLVPRPQAPPAFEPPL